MKTIKKILLSAALALMLDGCTKDDLSVCGVDILFEYTHNPRNVDEFGLKVSKIDLFVFDSV
ncbi:MAG: FimB/Mfa2 family fimbrial subunit, partial [Rikenellaceae bacterium]|nr:FimB/Mfa2 family fimbrial subunit [Rikenellaceae bacterium]